MNTTGLMSETGKGGFVHARVRRKVHLRTEKGRGGSLREGRGDVRGVILIGKGRDPWYTRPKPKHLPYRLEDGE